MAETINPGPRRSAALAALMVAMIAVPAAITLNTVEFPLKRQLTTDNATPHGYTFSLLLFLVPIAVIVLWLVPQARLRFPRKAFYRTLLILVPCGFALDFFFARYFFTFPNTGATLGVTAYALGGPVPIEEYVFYITGFMAVLLVYIWMDEYWLAAYHVSDYSHGKRLPRFVQFHWASAFVAGALIVTAVLYKKYLSPYPEGFPGYFTFLTAGGLLPSIALLPTVRPLINWRAFSLTMFFILLVSLLWEVTLAKPYGWWDYRRSQMLGISIDAWSDLPVEAVCVWVAVTYGTVIVFESIKLWHASDRSARNSFLGVPQPRHARTNEEDSIARVS